MEIDENHKMLLGVHTEKLNKQEKTNENPIFYIQYDYEDNAVYDYGEEPEINEEIELERY